MIEKRRLNCEGSEMVSSQENRKRTYNLSLYTPFYHLEILRASDVTRNVDIAAGNGSLR